MTDPMHLEFGWLYPDGTYVCDGCAVNEPFEHRCHGLDGSWQDQRACDCPECRQDRS